MTGFIGGGNMAQAIISGMLANSAPEGLPASSGFNAADLIVSDKAPERLNHLHTRYGVMTTDDNREVTSSSGVIILAVKPQNIGEVLSDIKNSITEEHLIISIAAGIRLEYLSGVMGIERVVRVMPNTPALIREGMSVISPMPGLKREDIELTKGIFSAVGKVLELGEEQMDAVTALSGSGPAFFAYFIESMIEAGILLGIDADDALALTLQTASGTVKMLESGQSPAELRKMVTSPGGTTAAGLSSMQENAFNAAVKAALKSAALRSAELSKREE